METRLVFAGLGGVKVVVAGGGMTLMGQHEGGLCVDGAML